MAFPISMQTSRHHSQEGSQVCHVPWLKWQCTHAFEKIDKIVKNTPAYQCLLASFLYPTTPNRYEIPISLQFHIFSAMKDIIEIHPCNYFVVEHTNSVPQFIESMENYDIQIQKGIMELLIFIMVDLNFVPLKELAVLSLHLQSKSFLKVVCPTNTNMVYRQLIWKNDCLDL